MASSTAFERELREVNCRRIKVKGDFTSVKFKLVAAIKNNSTQEEVAELSDMFDVIFGELMRVTVKLSEMYLSVGDVQMVD